MNNLVGINNKELRVEVILDKCTKCGYGELRSDMRFCPICGLELVEPLYAEKKLLSIKEFSAEYSLPIKKAYEMAHTSKFPKIIVGKKILIIRHKVDDWLEDSIGSNF